VSVQDLEQAWSEIGVQAYFYLRPRELLLLHPTEPEADLEELLYSVQVPVQDCHEVLVGDRLNRTFSAVQPVQVSVDLWSPAASAPQVPQPKTEGQPREPDAPGGTFWIQDSHWLVHPAWQTTPVQVHYVLPWFPHPQKARAEEYRQTFWATCHYLSRLDSHQRWSVVLVECAVSRQTACRDWLKHVDPDVDVRLEYLDDDYPSFHRWATWLHSRTWLGANDVVVLANGDVAPGPGAHLLAQLAWDEAAVLQRRELTRAQMEQLAQGRDAGSVSPTVSARGGYDAWALKGKSSWGRLAQLLASRLDHEFRLGQPGCDSVMNWALLKLGKNLLNPSLQVCLYHFHQSHIRHYDESTPGVPLPAGERYVHVRPTVWEPFRYQPASGRRLELTLDLYFFVSEAFSGISRLWCDLIQGLLHHPQAPLARFTLLERAGSERHWPHGLRNQVERCEWLDLVQVPRDYSVDRETRACDLFLSTYYTYRPDTPSVLYVHDTIPESLGWSGDTWDDKRRAVEHAAGILCPSETTRAQLYDHYPHLLASPARTPVRTVRHRVQQRYPDDLDFKMVCDQDGTLDPQKHWVLMVGDFLAEYKRWDWAARAWRRLSQEDPEWLQQHQLVVRGQLPSGTQLPPGTVWLRERLPEGPLAALYRHAALLLQTSDLEGFGLTVAEARTQGTLCLVRDTPVNQELYGDDLGVLQFQDFDDLVATLGQLNVYLYSQDWTDPHPSYCDPTGLDVAGRVLSFWYQLGHAASCAAQTHGADYGPHVWHEQQCQ